MLALGDLRFQSDSAAGVRGSPASASIDIFNQDPLKYYNDVEGLSDNDVLVDMARFKKARVLERQGKYQEAFNVYNALIGHSDKSLNTEVSQALGNAVEMIGMKITGRLYRGERLGALQF